MPELKISGEIIRYDNADIVEANRCDFISKSWKVKKTDEGYLTGIAPVAKVGIMKYLLPDGSTRKEFVPSTTLFNKDSMETLKMKPITDTHPPERLISSKTVKRRKVGYTGETVNENSDYLDVSLTVTDDDSISNIQKKGRNQLSPGYKVQLLLQSGTYNNEHYDAIQINRQYNHVAICDRARGGSDLKLNVDSIEELHVDGFEIDAELTYAERKELPDSDFCYVKGIGDDKIRKFPVHDAAHVRNALSRLPQSNLSPEDKKSTLNCILKKAKKFNINVSEEGKDINADDYNLSAFELTTISKEKQMAILKIDGIDYEAAQEVVNLVNKLNTQISDVQKKFDELNSDFEKIKADNDSKESELKKLKDSRSDEISKAVKSRIDVLSVSTKFLDDDDLKKVDNMSDKDIKKMIILKAFPKSDDKIKDASDDYVDARYDSAVEILKNDKSNVIKQKKSTINSDGNKDNDDIDQDKSRNDMINRMKNAWKKEEK